MTRRAILGPIPVFDGEARPGDQEAQREAFATDYVSPDVAPELGMDLDIGGETYMWRLVESDTDIVDLSLAVTTQPLASASGYRLLSGHDSSPSFEPRAV